MLRRLQPLRRAPSLRLRLALSFGSLLLLMGLVVVVSVLQFRALARHGVELLRDDLQRMLRVQQIHQHAQGHGSDMVRLLTAPRAERELLYPLIDSEYAQVDTRLSELVDSVSDASQLMLLTQLVAERSAYREFFGELVVWVESGELGHARELFNRNGQRALSSMLATADALMARQQAGIEQRQHDILLQSQRSEWLLAGLAGVGLALALLLAWRTTVSVARPLRRLEHAALRIADGEYGTRVLVRGGDELTRVAQAMNEMAMAVAARETEIERLAFVDRLTGLPNRMQLLRAARELDAGGLCVVLMDVARLRTVNEVLGFDAGDQVLVHIAERLRLCVDEQAAAGRHVLLARLSGGVFALLCAGLSRPTVEQLCERVDQMMATPVGFQGHAVDVSLLHGLAHADGDRVATAERLLRGAELAATAAKRDKSGLRWYVPVEDLARQRQLSLLSSLRSGVARGELEMWLQPKQCLRNGRILGMEALVRWRHPDHGYVSPAEFIVFAERTGHIGVVTEAMLDAACARLASWRHEHPNLSIAVNVSALDIQRTDFVQQVQRIAMQHAAPLRQLRLEITESSLMNDADQALRVLCALRGLGVQLSIDDFGTGYSSLAYLNRLPVNELKIDRSFVSHADGHAEARALLATIIELGHSLDMCVTAEGIERPEELALLRELGCDQAQGFLISRPLDPRAATAYLRALVPGTLEPQPA